jgi:putative glutamine amidotransferase
MQMINVYFGGQLVQDIPSQLNSPIPHDHAPEGHPLTITDARFAQVIQAEQIVVNTFHHQGVTADRLAPDLDSFAVCAADGIIEGIAHRRYPVLGVQWHPERPSPSREQDARLFRRFLKEGAFWQIPR